MFWRPLCYVHTTYRWRWLGISHADSNKATSNVSCIMTCSFAAASIGDGRCPLLPIPKYDVKRCDEECEPPTCDVSRTPITSRPNLATSVKSSLNWPTLAIQFNDFSADIGQPTAHVIHYKTYRDKWEQPLLHMLPYERVSFLTSTTMATAN